MFQNAVAIIRKLESAGYEARIAGGAVRDMILGEEPKDYDIATTATPDVVMTIFPNAVATGLQHGTVTVPVDHIPYEVTTLRIDRETDGRHAMVEFTTDWEADAARRDFTMNAMYMDADQKVYDYFGGQKDLDNLTIRFVGNTRARIEEDYLRIMRYFRFLSRFEQVSLYQDLDIIKELAPNLSKISGERIWAELTKLYSYQNGRTNAMHDMNTCEIWKIFGFSNPWKPDRTDDNHLCAMAKSMGQEIISFAHERCKVSTYELDILIEMFSPIIRGDKLVDIVEYAYQSNRLFAVREAILSLHYRNSDVFQWFLKNDPLPKFPVSGKDLLNEGFSGKLLGEELRHRRRKWIEGMFENESD